MIPIAAIISFALTEVPSLVTLIQGYASTNTSPTPEQVEADIAQLPIEDQEIIKAYTRTFLVPPSEGAD